MKTLASRAAAIALLFAASPLLAAEAETLPITVTISEMHLCCKGCTNAVNKAVAKVPGVTCKANQDELTTVLTADNPKDLQKAVDEIAAAGFYGKVGNTDVTFKPIEFKEGENVRKLEVAHIHNCCKMCTDAITEAIEAVPGVKSNTVKNKQVSFVVEGDFSPTEVIAAIQAAGFYPTLKGKEEQKP
jgi:periplasmic mercuric ion binding protein